MNKKAASLCFAGVVVIVFSIVLVTSILPKVIDGKLKKSLAIQNGTNSFKYWKKVPVPLKFSVYIFNVTNPAEVTSGAKPILREMGPYVYDEYIEKIPLNYSDFNETITFMRRKTYFFNQSLSGNLTELDNVTVLNFAYMGIITTVNEQMKSLLSLLNSALPSMFNGLKDPFLRSTVGDILFRGVFLNCSGDGSEVIELVCEGMKMQLPPNMKFIDTAEKKGFYMSMLGHTNGTDDGPLEVNKGIWNLSKLGMTQSFLGKNSLTTYKGHCAEIRGTDGTNFPPMDKGNISKKIYIFEPNICRSMFVELKNHNETLGLKSYRYEVTALTMAGKCKAPENSCFCKRNWSSVLDSCTLDGVHDVAACQKVPVIVSFPHFYLGSNSLLDYAEGLNPKKEKHGTYVELERLTSVPLRGYKRLQFNMQMDNMSNVPTLTNITSGLFPILWVEEGAEVNDDIIEQLKKANYVIYVVELVQWLPFFVGVFLLIASVYFYFKSSRGHLAMKTNTISYMVNSGENGVKNNSNVGAPVIIT